MLIPNKDHKADLRTCITSLMENTTWKNLEIIVIENNSEEEETFAYYEELKKQYSNVQVVRYEGSFNYSAINNFGARYATGDYILLLNNDTEALTPDWLERMLGYCQREDVAIAGAKPSTRTKPCSMRAWQSGGWLCRTYSHGICGQLHRLYGTSPGFP